MHVRTRSIRLSCAHSQHPHHKSSFVRTSTRTQRRVLRLLGPKTRCDSHHHHHHHHQGKNRNKYEIKQTPIEPLVASLTRPLSSRLGQAVDVLVFNPPYVPTSDDEADAAQHRAGIAGSWAGGADGMQVTDTLLRQVDVRVCLFFASPVSCDRTRTRSRSRRVIYRVCSLREDDFIWWR